MNKQILSIFVFCAFSYSTQAQEVKGGISDSMMQQIKQSYANTPTDKAIRNAIGNNDIRKLALNQDNLKGMDTHFSIKVSSKGITDQKSSGRCWLFTGLNVMRAKAIAKHNLGSFEFSQTYSFFFDQLEKANLFLQGIIDTSSKPMDDKMVEWLFRNPLSDGGTFTGVADIVSKYGLVPKDVMPETNSSENTSRMAGLIALKLREQGLQLRDLAAQGVKPAALEKTKTEMLSTIYRMLVLNLGVPPTEFTWTEYNAKGEPVSTEIYTPLSFLKKYGDEKLIDNYVMLMNDPSREIVNGRGNLSFTSINLPRLGILGQKFMGLTPEQCVDMAKKYVKESLGAAEGTENTAKLMEYIDKPGAIRLIFNTEKPIPVEAFDTLSDTDPSIKLDVNTGPKTALELMADLEKK